MRQSRTSGSVGAPGGRLPGATRPAARIVREPGPMKHGSFEIAFIEDPDGYKIELIQLRGP